MILNENNSLKHQKTVPELLAPGGSPEGIRACIAAGADAVYTGGKLFGARAYAQNAEEVDLLELIDLCHIYGKKLYLTVNTLLKEPELEGMLYDYLEPLYRHGLDAVLVQDLGVLSFIRQEFPGLPVHASTQMSVSSVSGARLLKRLGAVRIVPARELSLEEIARIHREVPIEIETFIHGALCYSYSGQCLMSSMIGGRSGNRGRCAQPCRQKYEIGQKEKYLLSLKDICTLEILPEILDAGVCSLKIEGRMKRTEYAAGVTAIYRRTLDRILHSDPSDLPEPAEMAKDRKNLMDLYNRGGFSEGFYPGKKGPAMMAFERPNHAGTAGAEVVSRGKLRALEDLNAGDLLEISDRGGSKSSHISVPFPVKEGKLFSPEEKTAAVKGQFPTKGTVLPRVRNEALLEKIRSESRLEDRKIPVRGSARIVCGEPVQLCAWTGENTFEKDADTARQDHYCENYIQKPCKVCAEGDIPQAARGAGMTRQDFEKQLRKTGDTPFTWEDLSVDVHEGLFVPVSALNRLRRDVLQLLEKQITESFRRLPRQKPDNTKDNDADSAINSASENINDNIADNAGRALKPFPEARAADGLQGIRNIFLSASVQSWDQLKVLWEMPQIRRLYIEDSLLKTESLQKQLKKMLQKRPDGRTVFLMLPPVWREDIRRRFYDTFPPEILSWFDGLMIRNFQQLEEETILNSGSFLITDEFVYSWNRRSRMMLRQLGADQDTVPSEQNRRELAMRGCERSELPVYGREVMMTTASCIQKNTRGCTKDEPVLEIKDRFGAVFPVRCMCGICTNRIYNSVPLDLSSRLEEAAALCPASMRLRFTFETAGETELVAGRFADLLSDLLSDDLRGINSSRNHKKGGRSSGKEIPSSTRGHFERGVE